MTSLRVVHSDARFSRKTRPQPSRTHAHALNPLIPANLPPIAPTPRRYTSLPRKNATEAIDFQWFINEKNRFREPMARLNMLRLSSREIFKLYIVICIFLQSRICRVGLSFWVHAL